MDGKLTAKQKMRVHAELIRQHYQTCQECCHGSTCKQGKALWDEAARKQVAVIRGCLTWENRQTTDPTRADRLLDRMIRSVDIVTRETRRDAR